MSQEIRANATLSVTKSGLTSNGNAAQTISMSGSNHQQGIMTIGTTYTNIATGSLADIRYLYIANKSTASVDVTNNSTSSSLATLQPEDVMMLPPANYNKTWYVKSSAPASDIAVVMTEQ